MMTESTETQTWTQYAEFRRGTSNKFYEVTAEGRNWTFRWGRIGAAGQSKQGVSYSFEGAKRVCQDQMAAKTSKGYKVVSALEALASACQEPEERPNRGLGDAEIRVPTNWAMYTSAGNQRMTKFGEKYLGKLNLIRRSFHDLTRTQYTQQVRALLTQYVREWRRIAETRQCSEANDTAVREVVAEFYERLRHACGIWDVPDWGDLT